MKRSYSVELRAAGLDPFPAEALEPFCAALFQDRSIAGAAPGAEIGIGSFEVQTSVDATTISDAIAIAERAFDRALRKANVATDVVLARAWLQVNAEDPEELISGAEVARRMKISRQRVAQLAEAPSFPRAAAKFGKLTVWRWGDIAEWARLHERRVKQPRRKAS